MRRLGWIGWLVAGLLLVQNAVAALAAPGPNPLEGHLLRDTAGGLYLYHNGFKFPMEIVDIGDGVIDAIPTGSAQQWNALFTAGGPAAQGVPQVAPAGQRSPSAPGEPAPFPGYS